MNKLLLTFYGDDFTGSTDALEQLTLAGIRAALFVEPPMPAQLKKFSNLQAIGVAGMTRSMTPRKMEAELRPAFLKLKKLGARHVHYKVCSTFDSSPQIGSIGRVLELGAQIFSASFVPILAAAPALGRYTIFGNHFACFGIGSDGQIHRLDRHPAASKHPVTPMTEADLRVHLSKQTKKKIALFDLLKIGLPANASLAALKTILAQKPDAILFDALTDKNLQHIAKLLDGFARAKQPLFSIGSSGIESALAMQWRKPRRGRKFARPVKQILAGSGSCSPVTSGQISFALKKSFAEVALSADKLAVNSSREIQRATDAAVKFLQNGRSVIIHTTKTGSEKRIVTKLKNQTAKVLGTALGNVLRGALERTNVSRLCIAGGDTSSFAARALGIQALEMIAPLTPGAPLCKVSAPNSPVDGKEIVFKGGQVGAENYFETVLKGK
ncbi:MAG TPA: four-carbon acid sugar kinase family protein [Verrucomicrobiae bacterium]|nr:four-carbon acid sugar kinase family protein [Verrucomicrobiae bacterium]